MPRAKKDDAIVEYVRAHPKMSDRSADTMAVRLGLSETDLRALVHESGRVYMRSILLGWHVVELAPGVENEAKQAENKGLDTVDA